MNTYLSMSIINVLFYIISLPCLILLTRFTFKYVSNTNQTISEFITHLKRMRIFTINDTELSRTLISLFLAFISINLVLLTYLTKTYIIEDGVDEWALFYVLALCSLDSLLFLIIALMKLAKLSFYNAFYYCDTSNQIEKTNIKKNKKNRKTR